MNNFQNNTNLLVDLFILNYSLFFFRPTTKESKNIYIYIYIYIINFLLLFYNSDNQERTQMIQSAKRNNTQSDIRGKSPKTKKRLKTYVLLENNQPITHAEPNEKSLNRIPKAKRKSVQ